MTNKMKTKMICFISALLLFPCSSKAENPVIGGSCTYTKTPGQATIVSLNNANPSSNNCNHNPVEVVFDFAPDNPADAFKTADKNRVLTVGDGKNPPLNYVLSKGLSIGTTHPCIKQNIASGTCTPVIFTFTDVDLSDYAASCF